MWTPQKASLLACSLLIAVVSSGGQAPSTPPPSSAGIYPLSAVHAGLHGTAYTVFQGNAPEPFGVDILGVLHNAQGPGEDLILARLTGAKAEYTGVVAGMSGSPVYIDGKLAGALAFRIGEFAKEPIAGITPIAQMLPVQDPSGAGPSPARAETTAHDKIAPIDTPLVFSGFSPEALALWKEHAPQLGITLEPEAGLGGSGNAAAVASSTPLEPGSAVSALLVAGDMEIAATCTVTYLDQGHLLACGHPLTQFGAVSLPMTEADVVATLASPAGSFKIVNTGKTVGAFTQDRQTAIGGLLGQQARMIPVTITIHPAHGNTQPPRTIHLQVLDQAQMTPTAMLVSLFQALQETPGYAEEDSYRVHTTVALAGSPAAAWETLAAPGGLGNASVSAALTTALRFSAIYSSSDRQSTLENVSIDVEALPGRQAATLSRAAIEQFSAHAGSRITVDATLAPYRGAAQVMRIPVTLPSSLPQGDVRLLVSDGSTLDRLLAAGRSGTATPLAGTVEQLNSIHADDHLYITLLSPDAELSIDGRTLASVPPSVVNALVAAHERDRPSLHGESVILLGSTAVDQLLTGEQVLTLRVGIALASNPADSREQTHNDSGFCRSRRRCRATPF